MVGFNYAPSGWATCDGQLLSITQHSALFAVLGAQFGGNGYSTFALPDLRGRAPIHQGTGNGLSPHVMGELGGDEKVTLTTDQMPEHTHTVNPSATTTEASTADPSYALPANSGTPNYAPIESFNASMATAYCSTAGANQAHDNMAPFGVVNFIIALEGVFPPHQ